MATFQMISLCGYQFHPQTSPGTNPRDTTQKGQKPYPQDSHCIKNQALEMPILWRCTILYFLQQQRKFFLKQRHIFTQRAEADVEDEIDHFFQLEKFICFRRCTFRFPLCLKNFQSYVFCSHHQSTLIYSEEQLCSDQPRSSAGMLNCKNYILDATIIPLKN